MNKTKNFFKEKYITSILLFLFISLFIIMIFSFIRNGTYSVEDTTKITLECPDVLNSSTEFECSINLHVAGNDTISGMSANYSLPDTLSFVSFTGSENCSDNSCMETYASTENGIVLVNIDGVKGDAMLGKFKLKFNEAPVINKTYNVSLSNIELSNDKDELITLGNVTGEAYVIDGNSTIIVDNEKKIISRIPLDTTYENLINTIRLKGTTVVKTKDGTEVDKSTKVKTSDIISVTSNNSTVTYTVSVIGDVSGDGQIKINDIDMIYRYLKGKLQLDEAKVLSGDVVRNGSIKINDVDRLYRYLKGRVVSLEVSE